MSRDVSAGRPRRDSQFKRPNVLRRRRRCQAYLLWATVKHGTVKAAIDELLKMQVDRAAYTEIVPDGWLLSEDTLRRYWRQIPIAVRVWAGTQQDPGAGWEGWLIHLR